MPLHNVSRVGSRKASNFSRLNNYPNKGQTAMTLLESSINKLNRADLLSFGFTNLQAGCMMEAAKRINVCPLQLVDICRPFELDEWSVANIRECWERQQLLERLEEKQLPDCHVYMPPQLDQDWLS